jgi:Abnormal spindle-like microcephaly-assoc'd, ASPM-SPD-2-Hydin
LYAEGYSQFCYELPFMPGTTEYLDTPVVPTSAFAGAGYNNVDCAYPDATPAVSSVVNKNAEGSLPANSGPWVSAAGAGHQLTITALGAQTVPNNAYSGPSATTAPYNQKTIVRHYGFGAQCTTPTAGSATCNTLSSVTIGGVPATINSWTVGTGTTPDTITVTVASTNSGSGSIPTCAVQQQAIYGGSTARCGELVITAGNGKQSVDAVTVTIGGKTPTLAMKPGTTPVPLSQYSTGTIQNAIDAAAPGDLIIVPAGTYSEMVLMWKPVRLQGVGAASSIIDANTQPAGKLDPWRREVNCLFGLALNGTPLTTAHSQFDPTANGFTCGTGAGGANFTGTPTTLNYFAPIALRDGSFSPQIDRLPLEAVVGWDATLNGNLAQLLQEATLMGALEGAGVTVLGKGVHFPSNPFAADTFPTGTTLLSSSTCARSTAGTPLASNFYCNPSGINSLSIIDSSQGGGGIFLHGWGHNVEIANDRIKNNAGTLSGGINVGQGEFPPAYIAGGTTNADPGSCATTGRFGTVSFNGQTIPTGAVEPYCQNLNVNIHNNYVSLNSSTGDELFSAAPAGAGGVSFCTGADNYKFNYNWVCGNLSSGDGGGLGHMGLSYNGDIEHNTFLFNQSLNPTIPANGGAIIVMGAPDVDPPCSTLDQDCVSAPGAVGPSDGVGQGLVINANLIMGNGAEAGTGGGISFQNVNGSDVVAFPTTPANWWHVKLTNNIIADNVAGWDGAGISLLDTLNIDIVNNTIISNSTTASAGVLFTTLGAPLASQPGNTSSNPSSGVNCTNGAGTASCPQVAGLVSEPNSSILNANLPSTGVVCPANHYTSATAAKGNCGVASVPELYNNLIWQNSAYYIGVGALSNAFQQNVVSLYNAFTTTLAPTQPSADSTAANGVGRIITGGTGACLAASYWDIGVRGDLKPGDHTSGVTLAPSYSTLTSAVENGTGSNNEAAINPGVASQYCDGSRQPPEWGQSGWAVPAGISDAIVPNPIFNLTPVATVDEGNNWINLRWGPLTLVNPVTGALLGNYAPGTGSPVINYITSGAGTAYTVAPTTDFFGNARKGPGNPPVDIGAVQHTGAVTTAIAVVQPSPAAFGTVVTGTTSTMTLTLRNDGGTALTGIVVGTPAAGSGFTRTGNTCGATLPPVNAPGNTCTVTLQFAPTAAVAYTGTLPITASVAVNGAPVSLTGTGVLPIRTATVSPSPLAFGNWADGTTSNARTLTVTNSGNFALTGGTIVTFGGGTPQPFSRAGGTCGAATLNVGATCTINVVFSPAAGTANNTAFSRTLTVAYAGATVTPTPVQLTGTAVTAQAPMSILPNPLTITTRGPFVAGSGVVTLTNTAAAGGSQVLVNGIAATGGSFLTYLFGAGVSMGLPDTCTGAVLAPQASCTVQVDFIDIFGAINVNHTGTILFTDSGAGSPQSGALIGVAR